MNLVTLFNITAMAGFLAALIIAARLSQKHLGQYSKWFLVLFLVTGATIGLANFLEHARITSHYDRYEDFLEVLLIPLFLFFMYAVGNHNVLTARREIEAQLTRLDKAIESTSDAIAISDNDGMVVYGNPALTNLTGYNIEEINTAGGPAMMYSDSEAVKEIITYTLGGEKWRGELEIKHRSGRLIPVEARQDAIKDEAGLILGVIALHRDISLRKNAEKERKALEGQLIHAQKMESIGTLAGGVAHDFNNLIHAISGYAQLLLLDKDETDADYQVLNEIEAATKRASELTRQLLVFSRKITSQLNPTDLNAQIKKVKQILERTIPRMIKIEHQLSDGLHTILADANQIEQVLLNLAVNASHAMPEGGQLLFATRNTVLDEAYCEAHLGAKPGEYVQLTVTDTGMGMPPETVSHIFEPFFTTKEVGKGTGLGLSIVYGIIKNHKGYITCHSEPDKGTSFKLYFPVMATRSDAKPAQELERMIELHGDETVLVVDDDPAVLNLAINMLTRYGYTTLTATSGEEAISTFETDKDRIALIILDLNMPGMGGHKCLAQLLEMDPDVRVIVASGYSPNGSIKEMLESGPHEFIGKPFQLRDMLKTVRAMLDK